VGVSWTIAVAAVDDASRSILIEMGSAPDTAGQAATRLPTIELPDGEPSVDLATDLIERLLDRPIEPFWMHYEEADDELVAGVGAIMLTADPARDATATREFVPAEEVVDALEPALPRPYIRAWLQRLAGHRDPRTQPWLQPGWHRRASAWIAERMTATGIPPTGPTRITYQSPIGMVLRTPAADRDVYLKCPAPQFHAEPSTTRALAGRTPGWVPDVIDVEPTEGWLLMHDLGDRQLGAAPEAAWADGLRRLGEVQRAWVDHGDELLAAGGAHRPLAALIEAVPALLDGKSLGERLGDRLEPDLLERWPALGSRLVDVCRELEDIGLPDALIHGDAHPWNIAVTDHGHVVFDWSDAAVGPSFTDLSLFLFRTKDLGIRRVLRDAYLDVWAGTASRARLERAAELAMTAGALYQVVTYHTLVPGLPPEDQPTWAGADANWFRNTIAALDKGLDALDQRSATGA
jgi:hypothetical protein